MESKNERTLTAEEYLAAIIARNPAIGRPDDETVTLKARGIRALIIQAHAKGEEHGRKMAAIIGGNANIFDGIFGGRNR